MNRMNREMANSIHQRRLAALHLGSRYIPRYLPTYSSAVLLGVPGALFRLLSGCCQPQEPRLSGTPGADKVNGPLQP